MNPPAPTPSEPAFPGQRAVVILGAALVGLFGLALLGVLRDNAHRADLETVVESNAVGDTHYLKIPEPPPEEPYPVVAHLAGKALVPTGYKRHEKREAELEPLAKDEATGLTIYQAPTKPKEAGEPPTYYIKVGPGDFLKVRPAIEEKQ